MGPWWTARAQGTDSGGRSGARTEEPLPSLLISFPSRAEVPEFLGLETLPFQCHQRVALSGVPLYRFWAVEKVFLPIVGAVVNGEFRPWGEGL